MSDPLFFRLNFPLPLAEIASLTQAILDPEGASAKIVMGAASLEEAGGDHIVFFESSRYASFLIDLHAGACFISPKNRNKLPEQVAALVVESPALSMARLLSHVAPESLRSPLAAPHLAPGFVHPEARLEPGVDIDAGAVIGAGAEIGAGARIGAHVSIGAGVRIGRQCDIGAGSSLAYACLGDRVILHPGVRLGQDGFGFAREGASLIKFPHLGRVIIQDDVEIGANTTIDRGSTHDTMIGEGTKIDNLVQIAHNVILGRHCVIAAQTGVAGSTRIDDYVAIGGQVGIAGHLHIGKGAQIAAQSGVMRSVAPFARIGGSPAQDLRNFLKDAARARRG